MPAGSDDLHSLTPDELARRCAAEQERYHQGLASDDRYCLALFQRAMYGHDEFAWSLIYQRFSPTLLAWLHKHRYANAVLAQGEPDSFVTAAFGKFWQATAAPGMDSKRFPTLAAALEYLKRCLNSAVMDAMRQLEARQREESLENVDTKETGDKTSESAQELWDILERALPDRRERRLAYLLFVLDYKPREVAQLFPRDFPTAQEVYRMTRNMLDRLRRNPSLLSWLETQKGRSP